MRVKAGVTMVCFFAWLLFFCAQSALQAQTSTTRPLYQPPTPSTGVANQDSSNDLFVAVDKSVLVDVAHPIQRIAVGLGEFAEATAISPSEVLVNGKAPGETTLIVWEAGRWPSVFQCGCPPKRDCGQRSCGSVTPRAQGRAARSASQGKLRERPSLSSWHG